MKYVVTGGAGFIGSHLVDALVDQKHEVHVIDNFSTGKKENCNTNAIYHNYDISDTAKNKNFIKIMEGADSIFHCAALARVQPSINNPVKYEMNNTIGTMNMLKGASDAKVRRFIYSASSAVYGSTTILPSFEHHLPNPSSPYGSQKYYGEMIDGSALPEWIKVDPKTGRTKTNIPKGEKLVEFKIIAVDTDNNKKQVTVIIDPEKIAKDKEILKEVRKTAKAKIMINKDGSIKLKSINKDGTVNKTTTDAINENKNFEDVVKKIKPNEFLKLEANLRNNDFVVELPDEIKTNFKSLKVVLKNGKEIPNWIKLNPISGEIIANPPENVEKVELKIIIENENGEVTVKDIEINFSDVNPETTEKLLDKDIKFMPLSDQLLKEQTILDNYGSQIINNL